MHRVKAAAAHPPDLAELLGQGLGDAAYGSLRAAVSQPDECIRRLASGAGHERQYCKRTEASFGVEIARPRHGTATLQGKSKASEVVPVPEDRRGQLDT